MPKKYKFLCNKDPVEMDIGDSITLTANDRRQAYRLFCRKLGIKVRMVREAPKVEDSRQGKMFDEITGEILIKTLTSSPESGSI